MIEYVNLCSGAVPINCTIDYGDGHREKNGTSRHQSYTSYFHHHYERVGQFNVSIECSNQKSTKKSELTRTILRKSTKKNLLIYEEIAQNLTGKPFELISRNDFSLTNLNCLYLRNTINNQQMKVSWKNRTIQINSNQVIH